MIPKKKLKALRNEMCAFVGKFKKQQKKEQGYDPDYADINGIKLKRKNENKSMKSLTCKEALKVARRRGLIFPTTAEWEQIFELGSTWDDERIGTWIGANHALKAETDLSTFLPAEGFWYYSSVGQCRQRNDDGFSVRCVWAGNKIFHGFELNPKYVEISNRKIHNQLGMFA